LVSFQGIPSPPTVGRRSVNHVPGHLSPMYPGCTRERPNTALQPTSGALRSTLMSNRLSRRSRLSAKPLGNAGQLTT
jgi:hypothetical protein